MGDAQYVSPAITAAIASGQVPPYITAEYLMENRDRPAKGGIIFVGLLTTFVVLLRFISRWSVKRFGVDDVLAGVSLILQIAFIGLSVHLIDLGTGRHLDYIEYVMTDSQEDFTEELDFTVHLIYTSALFVCRLSGLAFYRRLCELHDKLSFAINCATVLLVAAYLPQMSLIIFHCKPVTALWPYSWQLRSEDFVCLTWGLVYTVNSGLSLFCDLFMFAIPVALIQTLKMPLRGKMRLYLVLLPGVLVIIISVSRLWLVVEGQWWSDGPWYYNPMLAIENAEIGGTLIALSIPGLKPLFARWFIKAGESWGSGFPTHPTLTEDIDGPITTITIGKIGTRSPRPNRGSGTWEGLDEESFVIRETRVETLEVHEIHFQRENSKTSQTESKRSSWRSWDLGFARE